MWDMHSESIPELAEADVVNAASLSAIEGLRHGFFTRRGGISEGLYAGLNAGIGSQDDPGRVRANRRAAVRYLGIDAEGPQTPWQVHSPDVAVIDQPFSGERPKADAVVTGRRGLPIGVVTADCGPILFADRRGRAVGAAHAGWKGALTGVLEATIEAMEGLGAERADMVAALGPCITQAHYEVGADRRDEIVALDARAERFFATGRPGKWQFDLPGYIVDRLGRAGVAASFVGRCTYGEPDTFFSFRRTTHRSEPDYGRQLSAIMLDPLN